MEGGGRGDNRGRLEGVRNWPALGTAAVPRAFALGWLHPLPRPRPPCQYFPVRPCPQRTPKNTHQKKKKKLPDSSQDDIGYADDAAAEAANPLASEDEDDEDEDGFDDPDESGYATATASLGDAASTDLDVLEVRQAEGKKKKKRDPYLAHPLT